MGSLLGIENTAGYSREIAKRTDARERFLWAHRGLEERVEALSLIGVPCDICMTDLLLLTFRISDSPVRRMDYDALQHTLALCGKFGVLDIPEVVFAKSPYVHMTKFNDSIDQLFRQALISEIEDEYLGDGYLGPTEAGLQAGQAVFHRINPEVPEVYPSKPETDQLL